MNRSILVDGREFVAGKRTGIGRFLEGLLLSTADRCPDWKTTIFYEKKSDE